MKKCKKDRTYEQQTRTASGKSAECRPPSYEELCAQNQNLRQEIGRLQEAQLRKDNAELRRDNEKLTEIFEFARREFAKKDRKIEKLEKELAMMRVEMKELKEENAALKSELKEEKAKVATLSKMLFEDKTDLPAGRQGNKTKAQKGRVRKQTGAALNPAIKATGGIYRKTCQKEMKPSIYPTKRSSAPNAACPMKTSAPRSAPMRLAWKRSITSRCIGGKNTKKPAPVPNR